MSGSNSLAEIARAIKAASKIVVASHYNPDPDAFGSSCGLALGLRALGKEVICVNEEGSVERLHFVPGSTQIVSDFPADFSPLLIACDCGDKKRLGDRLGPLTTAFSTVINIDHHQSNDLFGNLNYVVPAASSTSELVYWLLKELGAPLSRDTALALYLGILADTGSFRYSQTSDRTFETAAALVRAGAVPAEAAQLMFSQVTPEAMRLHSEALANMHFFADGRIVELVVTEEMVRKFGADPEDADDLKHISQTVAGVVLSVVIREAGDLLRVSLRSRSAAYDVAKLAEEFGGGGHKAASAFRWRKSLAELQAALRPKLEALLSQNS